MKKKPASKRTVVAKAKPDSLAALTAEVRNLILSARGSVASVADTFQVMTNFNIGRRIVEHEQKGKRRAAYGAELLKELSARLTEEFGRGFSKRKLDYMRRFFLDYADRAPRIVQKPSAQLAPLEFHENNTVKLASSNRAHRPSGENATIGLLLCKEKKDAVVKLTLPKDANIHAKEYQLYLPSKELLKAKLLEWTRVEEAKA